MTDAYKIPLDIDGIRHRIGAMAAQQHGSVADLLDRRILSALQVDGRASWRRVAGALGEAERTVIRRGTRLLTSGYVKVGALAVRGHSTVVLVRSTAGQARMAAGALARRPDCAFAHLLTGSPDCIAELVGPRESLAGLVMDELPGLPGVAEAVAHPVLRHLSTIREWQPGLLTDAETAALATSPESVPSPAPPEEPTRTDVLLLDALADDGRRTYDELARIAGVSEATARRRVSTLRRTGQVRIRAVIDPTLLGLPTEAVLRIRLAPGRLDQVAGALARSPYVRYASFVAGDHQLLVLAALPSEGHLYDFVTMAPWASDALTIETALILASLKRGGVPMRAHR